MPQTQYNLHLKGFVGGADFDRNYVDYILAKNAGKEVNVLIDSLGGNLATALSIAAAFKNHGKVSVHFVGMNASAATIASLGAAHISMDKNAMYLVHKCSTAFFEWGSLNADQFRKPKGRFFWFTFGKPKGRFFWFTFGICMVRIRYADQKLLCLQWKCGLGLEMALSVDARRGSAPCRWAFPGVLFIIT